MHQELEEAVQSRVGSQALAGLQGPGLLGTNPGRTQLPAVPPLQRGVKGFCDHLYSWALALPQLLSFPPCACCVQVLEGDLKPLLLFCAAEEPLPAKPVALRHLSASS